jgi:hypothetical protein
MFDQYRDCNHCCPTCGFLHTHIPACEDRTSDEICASCAKDHALCDFCHYAYPKILLSADGRCPGCLALQECVDSAA